MSVIIHTEKKKKEKKRKEKGKKRSILPQNINNISNICEKIFRKISVNFGKAIQKFL